MLIHGVSNIALIFDLDGVIVDSMSLHTRAWRLYLHGLGIQASDQEIEQRMHGRRNDDIVADFLGAALSPAEVVEHGAAKERLYRELMRPELERCLVPGIVDFLGRQSGTPIGLASNAEVANIDLVLDAAGLRSRFAVIVDAGQVSRPKPYPDVYLRAAEMLGVSPPDCVVFEDSPAGVEAARSAGTQVVGVLTHSADLLGVDISIRDFHEAKLESWLARFGAHASENN